MAIRYGVFLLSMILLTGCGINPVTKQREFQFVSESQEIAIGQQNYSPARQSQGGDYVLDPELTAYVQSIGQRLAAVSDRPDLPYEFVVLNDSVPNAWAMPGGKVAFNRGLLYELNSEAELAAVMGHEIVHAAARHGAKNMERGLLLQGAMIAVGIGAQNTDYANLIVGGAQLGGQLIAARYGRDAESEADLYGMQYMKKAGYDPTAAVKLQETFVKLSEGKRTDFISGLFASHPPSQARVEANKETLAELSPGGDWGKERYAERVAHLKSTRPAYQAYDEAIALLKKGDAAEATKLAQKAISIEPKEAKFKELLGDIALTEKKPEEALHYYDEAIKMHPNYFKPYIQSGIALYNMGKVQEAEPFLKRANAMLPTAPGYALLGKIAEGRGEIDQALTHYQMAAGSNSAIGKEAYSRAVTLDMPRNPNKYIQSGPIADKRGDVYAVVKNATGVSVERVYVRVVRYDPVSGRAVAQSKPLLVSGVLGPGERAQIAIGERVATQQELRLYKVEVVAGRVVAERELQQN